jgi:hypothetical protein
MTNPNLVSLCSQAWRSITSVNPHEVGRMLLPLGTACVCFVSATRRAGSYSYPAMVVLTMIWCVKALACASPVCSRNRSNAISVMCTALRTMLIRVHVKNKYSHVQMRVARLWTVATFSAQVLPLDIEYY